MKFFVKVLSVSLLFIACKSMKKDDHLPPALMKKVLTDVQLAETFSTMEKDTLHKAPGMKNTDSLSVFYKDVFAHYNITQAQFTSSLDWYKNHPDDMDSMYSSMLQTVTAMQTALLKK
jgi:hypothetical protein